MIRISCAATLAASLLLGTTLGFAPHARAQSNPTADQLINSLKPSTQSLHGPTRGIRKLATTTDGSTDAPGPAAGQAQASAAPPPPASATPASSMATPSQAHASAAPPPSANLFVQFGSGSAELTPQAMSTLDELGKALSSSTLAGYRFRIEGHTDTVGSKDTNLSLSERRAAAVADYIEHKFGVTQDRLVAVGLGSSHPLVPTGDQTPEARNRRVQVVNIGA